jgi:hypothetical protein
MCDVKSLDSLPHRFGGKEVWYSVTSSLSVHAGLVTTLCEATETM